MSDPDPNASFSSVGIPRRPLWLRHVCFRYFGAVCIWALKNGATPPNIEWKDQ